ncbi:MAG: hypothetical protein AB7E85_06670 [Pseudobdellovibrionaceae bacterium]
MQNKLTDIIDLVWDLADLALEYGHFSASSSGTNEQVMELCGLICIFENNDIKAIKASNIDLRLLWRSLSTANDNAATLANVVGLNIAEIFPESATFLRGDLETLKKWHADLTPIRGALVA